jgi:hypothetical protein
MRRGSANWFNPVSRTMFDVHKGASQAKLAPHMYH